MSQELRHWEPVVRSPGVLPRVVMVVVLLFVFRGAHRAVAASNSGLCQSGLLVYRRADSPWRGKVLTLKDEQGGEYRLVGQPVFQVGASEISKVAIIAGVKVSGGEKFSGPEQSPYWIVVGLAAAARQRLSDALTNLVGQEVAVVCDKVVRFEETVLAPGWIVLTVAQRSSLQEARGLAQELYRPVELPLENSIITANGVGPVQLGESVVKVANALETCRLELRAGVDVDAQQEVAGVDAHCGGLHMILMLAPDGHVGEIDVLSGKAVKTASGIGVGDDFDALRKLGKFQLWQHAGRVCAVLPHQPSIQYCLKGVEGLRDFFHGGIGFIRISSSDRKGQSSPGGAAK